MAGDITSKLLKLFCIDEYGKESIEPSSESILIFSFLLVGSVVFAASGQYLQIIPATICFIVSATSFGMTCLAFLAIILGYNRRRNYRQRRRRDNVAGTIDVNPLIAEKSVYIDIEIDFLESSCNAGSQRQLMNPSYMDNSQDSSQTSAHNTENDERWREPSWMNESIDETETDSYEADDFEEQESDEYNSSETISTIYYNSSSEVDDCNQITSEESYLNEVDESDFVSLQDCRWNPGRNLLEKGRLVEQKKVTTPAKDLSAVLQGQYKLDHVYLNHQLTLLQKQDHLMVSSILHSSSSELEDEIVVNSNSVECDSIHANLLAEDANMQLHLPEACINNFYQSKPHDIYKNNDRYSMIFVDNEYVVINIEDSQSTLDICDNFYQDKGIYQDIHTKTRKLVPCRNSNQTGNFFATRRQSSRDTLDFTHGLENSVMELSGKTEISSRWKWSERQVDMIRIKKRPLLDANGNPISQYAFVQELTELLRNGLKQYPEEYPGKKCM